MHRTLEIERESALGGKRVGTRYGPNEKMVNGEVANGDFWPRKAEALFSS